MYICSIGVPCLTAIWKMWTDFGIDEARMVGYWEEKPPVATDSPDVKATAFIRDGRTRTADGHAQRT